MKKILKKWNPKEFHFTDRAIDPKKELIVLLPKLAGSTPNNADNDLNLVVENK